MASPVRTPGHAAAPGDGGVGDSPLRPDGTLKVAGEFAYASDLWMDGMLWGATLRSPHPRARIRQPHRQLLEPPQASDTQAGQPIASGAVRGEGLA